MKAFFIAMLFGALEAVLLALLMDAVTNVRRFKVWFYSTVIFVSYGIVIWFVMFKYLSLLGILLCGFLAGLPLTGIVLFFLCTYLKETFKNRRPRRPRKNKWRRR